MFKMLPFQSNNVPISESLPPSHGLPESFLENYELPKVIAEEIETSTDFLSDLSSNGDTMANMNLSNNVVTNDALQYMENVNPIKQIIIKQDRPKEVVEKIASFTDYKIINSKKQILFKINLNDSLSITSKIFPDGLTSTNLYLKVVVLDEDVQNSNLDLDENMRLKVKQHQNSSNDCPCHGRFME